MARITKGGSGNDRLGSSFGNDYIYGGAGDDIIDDAFGNDHLYGGVGDDTIYDSFGNDHIYGGVGDDTIYDSFGNDHIYGGAGDDIIDDVFGDDHIDGGAGDDTIEDSWGDDHLYGGSGDDTIDAGWGDDVLYGGSGDDTLLGSNGRDVFVLNPDDTGINTVTDFTQGKDKIQISTATGTETTLAELLENTGITITGNTIFNADGDRVMVLNRFGGGLKYEDFYVEEVASLGVTRHGTSQSEYSHGGWYDIGGGWGDDTLYGNGGNDHIDGSWGDDVIYGGRGSDHITGGHGDDIIDGGAGNNTLTGNWGNDIFVLSQGRDTVEDFKQGEDKIGIRGGPDFNFETDVNGRTVSHNGGTMKLRGLNGELTLDDFVVFNGSDFVPIPTPETAVERPIIIGTSGNDNLIGGSAGDDLVGLSGDDTLDGGSGNDQLFGRSGDDILDGGSDNDVLKGGDDNDIFVLSQGDDTIIDFKQGEDKIGIREGSDFNFETNVDGNTISSADGTMVLEGFSGTLTRDDFVVFDGSVFVPIPEPVPTTITLNSDASKIAEANDVVETALTEVILAGDDTTGYTFTTDDARFAVNNGVLNIVAGSDFDYEAGATIKVTVTAAKADSDTLDATYTLTLIDAIEGTASHDTLYGTNGDDIIYGYDGQDHVSAGGGNDRIYGGDGNDVIFAGSGDDHLDGGNGDDHLNGQEDKDIFVLNFDYTGKDTVFGFEQGIDKIHIKKAHYDQIVKTDGSINIVEGVIKDADDNDVLVLQGFEGTLTKSDFSISQRLSYESVINNIGTVDENDEGADIDGLRFTLNDNIGIDDLTLVGVFEGDKAVSDKLMIKDYADGVYGLKLKDGESFDYEQRDYIYLRLEHEGANVDGGTLLIDINDVFEEVVEDVNDVAETVDESLNLIEGTAGADYLYGTSGDDLIRGFDGGDYMLGGSGSDIFDVTDSHIGFDIIADFERGVDKIRINFEFEELELSGPTGVYPGSATNDKKKGDLSIEAEDEVSGERFYVFIEDFDFDNPLTADDFEFVALEVI